MEANEEMQSEAGQSEKRGCCCTNVSHKHCVFSQMHSFSINKIKAQFSTDFLFSHVRRAEQFVKKKVLSLPPLQPVCAEPVEFLSHRGLFVSVWVFYLGLSGSISWDCESACVCLCVCPLCFVAQTAASLVRPCRLTATAGRKDDEMSYRKEDLNRKVKSSTAESG